MMNMPYFKKSMLFPKPKIIHKHRSLAQEGYGQSRFMAGDACKWKILVTFQCWRKDPRHCLHNNIHLEQAGS